MTARTTDQGSPATPRTEAGRDYDRGWMDRKLGLHRDANRQEANHYDRWFADGPPEVMDEQWLADTEAKMREALGDPFADDAAAVMLRLISTIREARAAAEAQARLAYARLGQFGVHISGCSARYDAKVPGDCGCGLSQALAEGRIIDAADTGAAPPSADCDARTTDADGVHVCSFPRGHRPGDGRDFSDIFSEDERGGRDFHWCAGTSGHTTMPFGHWFPAAPPSEAGEPEAESLAAELPGGDFRRGYDSGFAAGYEYGSIDSALREAVFKAKRRISAAADGIEQQPWDPAIRRGYAQGTAVAMAHIDRALTEHASPSAPRETAVPAGLDRKTLAVAIAHVADEDGFGYDDDHAAGLLAAEYEHLLSRAARLSEAGQSWEGRE